MTPIQTLQNDVPAPRPTVGRIATLAYGIAVYMLFL